MDPKQTNVTANQETKDNWFKTLAYLAAALWLFLSIYRILINPYFVQQEIFETHQRLIAKISADVAEYYDPGDGSLRDWIIDENKFIIFMQQENTKWYSFMVPDGWDDIELIVIPN